MAEELQEDLLTGIPEIDEQHQELFKRIDMLYASYINGSNFEETKTMFNYLELYIDEHFNTEENFMADFKYDSYLEHKREHELFKQEYLRLKDNYIKNGISAEFTLDLNIKIINWLNYHVNYQDKKLAAFLQDPSDKGFIINLQLDSKVETEIN